jgi:hypothetical protein
MATTTTTTQNILPAWWEQYTKNVLGRAEKATSGEYVPYADPNDPNNPSFARIAGFTPEQEQAFSSYKETMGSYQPYANAATAATNRAMGSFADPGVAGRYMNPYIQNVISGIGSTAARNLSENILPQINRTFVGGGTFGGSRSAEFTQRAIRDTQNAALSKQMEAMADAYKSGADLYGSEADRALQGAERYSALGESEQQQRFRELAGLEAIGEKRQALGQRSADLRYKDFEEQRDYDLNQVKELAGIGSTVSPSGAGTTIRNEPGRSGFASAVGTGATVLGAIGASGGFGSGGWLSGLFKKEGGAIESPVKNGKRNIKHPMHGLGWLKDVR